MITVAQVKKVEQYLEKYASTFPFSGSLILSESGKPLVEFANGLADRSFEVPVDKLTRFPVASLSKAFTCMAILLLQQEQKLNIQAAANKYLPSHIRVDGRITLHHLMSHTSGLPDYKLEPGENLAHLFATPLSRDIWVPTFLSFPPMFEPGTSYAYCNPGYYLLGIVIEEVSGQSFGDFLHDRIFQKLGMGQSSIDDPKAIIPNRAQPYELQNKTYVRAPFTDASNFYPQGGIISNIGDLNTWMIALQENQLLNKEWQASMFKPYMFSSPNKEISYGYGWHILVRHGRITYGHGGYHWGYRSHAEHYPNENISLFILSNNGFQEVMKLSDAITTYIFGGKLKMPTKPRSKKIDVQPYLGRYESGSFAIELKQEKKKYWMKWGKEVAWEVYPIDEGLFHHALIDESYRIRSMEDGSMVLAGCKKVS
ncbi:MAG: serine hydrolase domain-containing protein [Bacteroidota bacterium]